MSHKKIIALGLFLIFAISACASEEPQSVAPKAFIQETNDVEQGAANNEEPSSTAAATTATVCDEIYRSLMKMRWQPSLQIIPHYESEPLYIDALVNSIEKKVKEISWKPDLIISSYHGIPKSYFDKGDPYHCYCHKTTRLIKEKFNKIEIQTTFQSRFGPQEWLTPYTDKTLESLPEKGVKNLLVICPGFASDCVETLEEINIQGRESFIEKGGENFDLIPCLNDNSDHIKLFQKLIGKYL